MDISDILIFILAIIGVAVSSISKNAKKKAEARKQSTPGFDEWKKEYERPEKSEKEVFRHVPDLYSAPAEEYWSYDQQTIRDLETSPRVDDSNRETRPHTNVNNSQTTNNAYAIEGSNVEAESSGKSVIQTFSLRDAIIYNELLKPKFKED